MPSAIEFMQGHFWLIYASAIAWVATIALASAVFRKSRGKTLFVAAPGDSVFAERWTSGRSLRTFMGRLGGARNCLFVAVTPDTLIVRPHFPFSLLFLPEIYGLEITTHRSNVREVQLHPGVLGSRCVVTIGTSRADVFQVELRLRAPEQFMRALDRDG